MTAIHRKYDPGDRRKSRMRYFRFFCYALFFLIMAIVLFGPKSCRRRIWNFSIGRLFQFSVADRIGEFGPAALERLQLPGNRTPDALRLIALKEERLLELQGKFLPDRSWRLIKVYPFRAASGVAGPKLKEGDGQVPEGIYEIESLHPNSRFHAALKIAYPSREDIEAAGRDGRASGCLGSAIMLHGSGGSIGCIAVADPDIEEIFTLAASCGTGRVRILIAPFDFRLRPLPVPVPGEPVWLPERYRRLKQEMMKQE